MYFEASWAGTAKRKLERLQFSTSSSFVKIWSACRCEFKAYFWTFQALYHLLFDLGIIGVNQIIIWCLTLQKKLKWRSGKSKLRSQLCYYNCIFFTFYLCLPTGQLWILKLYFEAYLILLYFESLKFHKCIYSTNYCVHLLSNYIFIHICITAFQWVWVELLEPYYWSMFPIVVAKLAQQMKGGFHLQLLVFPFVYQL